jgi:bifunctional DNA-binding transcriptional regulator/antitoxin component of YhaV-PrlF toxin-antitoxin module
MTTVKLRGGGTITLPSNVRKKYKMQEGGFLQLIDVGDGSFFLLPKESEVARLSDKVAQQFKEDNVTLEDMLETLDEARKQYVKEKYGELGK